MDGEKAAERKAVARMAVPIASDAAPEAGPGAELGHT